MRRLNRFTLQICLISVGFLLFFIGLTWHSLTQAPIAISPMPVIYHFKPGTSTAKLAFDLESLGVLRKPKLFMRYVKYRGLTRRLQAGMYDIQPDISIAQLAKKLSSGDIIHYDFAIIEGWTVKDVLAKLANSNGLTTVLNKQDLSAFANDLARSIPHPEGLFLPETYRYPHGFSDKALLATAHSALIKYVENAWENRAEGLPYQHWYEALIVASLVEKETMIDDERAVIAGVILNRLEKKMVLQIDASVIYGLGESYDGDIKREHLRRPTPYNTYTEKGLPPTPIALPGRKAINAAMHPLITDYLYFVATGDGGHYFSRTLEEHNRAVKRYILNSGLALERMMS